MIYKRKTHTGKIVALTLLTAVSFAAYDYLTASRASALDDAASETMESAPIGSELLAAVDRIESLQLDGSIFTDSVFLSLEDKTATISPQSPGRSNPFAPLGSAQSAPAQTRARR